MYTIKGFSTKNKEEMMKKLKESGAPFKLPFTAETELKCKKNPLVGITVINSKGKEQKIVVN